MFEARNKKEPKLIMTKVSNSSPQPASNTSGGIVTPPPQRQAQSEEIKVVIEGSALEVGSLTINHPQMAVNTDIVVPSSRLLRGGGEENASCIANTSPVINDFVLANGMKGYGEVKIRKHEDFPNHVRMQASHKEQPHHQQQQHQQQSTCSGDPQKIQHVDRYHLIVSENVKQHQPQKQQQQPINSTTLDRQGYISSATRTDINKSILNNNSNVLPGSNRTISPTHPTTTNTGFEPDHIIDVLKPNHPVIGQGVAATNQQLGSTPPEKFEGYRMYSGNVYDVTTSDSKEGRQPSNMKLASQGKATPSSANISLQNIGPGQKFPSGKEPANTKQSASEIKHMNENSSVGFTNANTTQLSQPQLLYYQAPVETKQQQHEKPVEMQKNVLRDPHRQESRVHTATSRSQSQPRVVRSSVPVQRLWDDWSRPHIVMPTNALSGKMRPSSYQLGLRYSHAVPSMYGDPNATQEQAPPVSTGPAIVDRPTMSSYRLAPRHHLTRSTSASPRLLPKSILKNNNPAVGRPDAHFSTKPVIMDNPGEKSQRRLRGEVFASAPGSFQGMTASRKSPPLKKKLVAMASAPISLQSKRSSSAGSGLPRYDVVTGDVVPTRKSVTFNANVQTHFGNQISTIKSLSMDD